MKLIGMILVVLTALLFGEEGAGEELEIRAYRVNPDWLDSEGFGEQSVFSSESRLLLYTNRLYYEAPFESRFFDGEVVFRDLTASQRAKGLIWEDLPR